MFMLNNAPLAPDTPFTVGEGDEAIQYPANWLRAASAEEKAALGITEVADAPRADDRLYWNGDINNPKALDDVPAVKEDGTPIMVQVWDEEAQAMVDTDTQVVTKGLKSQWIAQVKDTANKLMQPTDWLVLRQLLKGIGMSAHVENYRDAVVAASNQFEAQITACATVEELAALQLTWPNQADF